MSHDKKFEDRTNRLIEVILDENSIGKGIPNVEHERATAIFDLIEENVFCPSGDEGGPYKLLIALIETKLTFTIMKENNEYVVTHILSLTPFKRIIKDYFMICQNYYNAIQTASPSQIEAIDMGRRATHNDGSKILQERFFGKIDMDFNTSRRLFTLVCGLHWRG